MKKTDSVIEKNLPDLRNLCNEFEKKVVAQEELAYRLTMMFVGLLMLFVLWLIFDEKAIWYLAAGFICFTSEVLAFLTVVALMVYLPRSKANSMRNGLLRFHKSII